MLSHRSARALLLLRPTATAPCASAPTPAFIVVPGTRGLLKPAGGDNIPLKITPRLQKKSTLALRNASALPQPREVILDDTSDDLDYRIVPNVTDTHKDKSPARAANQLRTLNFEKFLNKETNPLAKYTCQRKIKREKLSKYMQLLTPLTDDGKQINHTEDGKPLAIFFCWLMSQEKHEDKYTRLYTDVGIHVLKVKISPLDLMIPVTRSQVAATEILELLRDEPQWSKVVVHGLSVGAYVFMECMTKMEANEDRYLAIRQRLAGQVWDSPCDMDGLKEGVARSLTGNRRGQEAIVDALRWLLKVRYDKATIHYQKTQDMYNKNYMQAPSLFLYSTADPVSAASLNNDHTVMWHMRGHEVYRNIFEKSQHVSHFPMYKELYIANVMAFIEQIGVLKHAGINLN